MKNLLLIILLILSQCKGHDQPQEGLSESVSETSPVSKSSASPIAPQDFPRINPDECLLEAMVIKRDSLQEGYTYLLEVQNIFKRGFGFSENLGKGNQITAYSKQKT